MADDFPAWLAEWLFARDPMEAEADGTRLHAAMRAGLWAGHARFQKDGDMSQADAACFRAVRESLEGR